MKHFLLAIFISGIASAQTTPTDLSANTETYTIVEQMPEPPGGIIAFYQHIATKIIYPPSAREAGLQGKCFLKFVVDTAGLIKNVEVIKGVPGCPDCDKEALKVVQSYPNRWIPGKQNGKPVPVYYNIPVSFKMAVYTGKPASTSETTTNRSVEEVDRREGNGENVPFTVVENMPEPPEGISAFYKYIQQNVQTPKIAQAAEMSGKVFVRFVVEPDGSLSQFVIMKGMLNCRECDEEAIRVLQSYPDKWQPGKQNGRATRVYYNVKVSFGKEIHH